MRGQFTPDVVFAMSQDRKLYPEDQQRVDEYLKSGYNDTPRKPFKPLRMIFMLITVVTGFSILSIFLARTAGVY
ncbi:DUF3094 family protein [Litorivivens sp.]